MPDDQRIERLKRFAAALAKYLGGPAQVEMSIKLQMGKPEAELWSEIRSATPVFGYVSVEEAEQTLRSFLGVG